MIIPGGDSVPMLQFVEGPFDQDTLPVQFPVVLPRVPPEGSLWLDLGVITAVTPFARINAIIWLLSHPLSATRIASTKPLPNASGCLK